MPKELFVPWIVDAERHETWVATFGNNTGIRPTSIHSQDVAVHSAASDFADSVGWKVWCSQCEVPAIEEKATPHVPMVLQWANERAAISCDAAIFRSHDHGSNMLGVDFKMVLEAPHNPPILVVHAKDDELSRPFSAYELTRLGVECVEWEDDGDIHLRVTEWLQANRSWIESGPRTRQQIEADYDAVCLALQHAWQTADTATQDAVCTYLRCSQPTIRTMFREPLLVASCGDARLRLTCDRLGVNPDAVRIFADARQVLGLDELEAWFAWSRSKNFDFALGVLQAAAAEHPVGVIRARQQYLMPGAWDHLAVRYQKGDVA